MIKRTYGWKPDLPDHRDFLYKVPVRKVLATSVDLRLQDSPIYDQSSLGSCTANAAGGSIEFDFRKEGHADYVPSRLFIYYNTRVLEGTRKQDSGATIRDTIKSVATTGACPESLWPYNVGRFASKPCRQCYKAAKKDIVTKYESLQSVIDYKSVLTDGYPFVFGFSVYQSFESDEVARSGIVPMPAQNESVLGGHAVMAVGYNDSKNYFIVRNSWGSGWGDKGYFYLPYDYFTPALTDDFWVIYTVT
jgi:C1A family cysteine protease